MANSLWHKSGGNAVIVDGSNKPIWCDHCPCSSIVVRALGGASAKGISGAGPKATISSVTVNNGETLVVFVANDGSSLPAGSDAIQFNGAGGFTSIDSYDIGSLHGAIYYKVVTSNTTGDITYNWSNSSFPPTTSSQTVTAIAITTFATFLGDEQKNANGSSTNPNSGNPANGGSFVGDGYRLAMVVTSEVDTNALGSWTAPFVSVQNAYEASATSVRIQEAGFIDTTPNTGGAGKVADMTGIVSQNWLILSECIGSST